MILAIDIGNTRIKWGLRDGDRWRALGALSPADAGDLARQIPNEGVARTVIANVAGEGALRAILAGLGAAAGELVRVRPARSQCGVRNGYEDPAQLGADRWAALIGARSVHTGACVVVSAGTATTVDVLDASGLFRGGLILPGVEMMRRSLAHGTARLGLRAGSFTDFPLSTADAIESGCMQAQLGAVERQFARIAQEPGALCLVSGGAGALLYDFLRIPRRMIDNLVLEGLARIGGQAS
ncbi:MAG: type III pantothenate kinase [Rhodocyclaceae bacterium]